MRAIVVIAGLLFSMAAANAIECHSSPAPSSKNHWAWRLIDDKKCWYVGEPGMDKSKLHWAADADQASEPVKRTALQLPLRAASEPAKDAAVPPAPGSEPMTRPSVEAQPWSGFGIGLAAPASDIDWAARWPGANSDSSAVSILTGSDAGGAESQAPPQDHARASGAGPIDDVIFVLLTLCALVAWAFYACKCLPLSRFARKRIAHVPPSPIRPVKTKPEPHDPLRYSPSPPIYSSGGSARRKRSVEEIMAWR